MIYLGADYAGYKLKQKITKYFDLEKIKYIDIGTDSDKEKNDFTDFIPPVVKEVRKSSQNYGILICGTGIGMVIGANRFRKIRAALIFTAKQAIFSKTHDNANILCLSAWETNEKLAKHIIASWLKTSFKPLARRIRRFKKVDKWPT